MKKYRKVLNKGFDPSKFPYGVVIQEKLDGSNASFTMENGELKAFSRRKELDEEENLRGFYQYITDKAKDFTQSQKEALERYIVFGEWLIKGKLKYREDNLWSFFMFDVYDKEENRYLKHEELVTFVVDKSFVNHFSSVYMTVIYPDEMQLVNDKIDELMKYSARVEDNNPGEGLVVKCLMESNDCYKFITPEYREVKSIRPKTNKTQTEHLVDYAITKPRMQKMINRAIDENRLTYDDLYIQNFSKVMKEVGSEYVDDILEEEMENMIKSIKKRIGKRSALILREILMESET